MCFTIETAGGGRAGRWWQRAGAGYVHAMVGYVRAMLAHVRLGPHCNGLQVVAPCYWGMKLQIARHLKMVG